MIEEAATKIAQHAEMLKVDKSRNPLLCQLAAYSEEKVGQKKLSVINIIESSSSNPIVAGDESAKRLSDEREQRELLKGCISEIQEMLSSSSNISDAIYMIMETMYRGFGFNRVLFCMLDRTQTKMVARFGFGEDIDKVLENFEFKITRSSDFFNIAVLRMKDIIVDHSDIDCSKQNLPGWYTKIIHANSFLIYPLIIKEKCIGLLYADKKSTRILNDDQKDYMNILRDKAIWAILHKQ